MLRLTHCVRRKRLVSQPPFVHHASFRTRSYHFLDFRPNGRETAETPGAPARDLETRKPGGGTPGFALFRKLKRCAKLTLLQENLASSPEYVAIFVSFEGDNSLVALLFLAVMVTVVVKMRDHQPGCGLRSPTARPRRSACRRRGFLLTKPPNRPTPAPGKAKTRWSPPGPPPPPGPRRNARRPLFPRLTEAKRRYIASDLSNK